MQKALQIIAIFIIAAQTSIGLSIKSNAADVQIIDVTNLVTGNAAGHDCSLYLESKYDQTNHWNRCTICGKIYNLGKHSDDEKAWEGWSNGQADDCQIYNLYKTVYNCGYSHVDQDYTEKNRAKHTLTLDGVGDWWRYIELVCQKCNTYREIVHYCNINGIRPDENTYGYCTNTENLDRLTQEQRAEHDNYRWEIGIQTQFNKNQPDWVKEQILGDGSIQQRYCIFHSELMERTQATAVWHKIDPVSNPYGEVDITYKYYMPDNFVSMANGCLPHTAANNDYNTSELKNLNWWLDSNSKTVTIQYTVKYKTKVETGQSWFIGTDYMVSKKNPYGNDTYVWSAQYMDGYSTYDGQNHRTVTDAAENEPPVIKSIDQEDVKSTMTGYTDWATSKKITISGTENYCSNVKVEVYEKDSKTKIYTGTAAVKSDHTWSLNFRPNIEADENGKTYTVYAWDTMGNRVATPQEFTVYKIDNKIPDMTSSTATDKIWKKSKSYTAKLNDYGSGKLKIAFNNNNYLGTTEIDKNNYQQAFQLTGDVYDSAGVTGAIYIKDAVGNIATKYLTIYNLDNTKPQVLSIDADFGKDKTFRIFANDMHPILGEGSHVAAYMIKQDNTEPSESDSNWKAWTADVPETGSITTNTVTGYMEDSVNSYGVYYAFVKDAVGNISKPYVFEVKQRPRLYITAEPTNNVGRGYVTVDWSTYDWPNKYYKVYRQDDDGKTYQSVGVDYHLIKRVRVLQIYPDVEGQDNLHSWVVDTGYGQGIIQVDQVSQTNFNRNPTAYLNENNGSWNYDVLFFGTWDRNYYRDLSAASYTIVNKFAQSGHGIILGHDTALNNGRDDIYETNDGAVKHQQNYYDRLALDYLKIIYYDQGNEVGSTEVEIIKTGLFTTYPNYIGVKGTKLTIPACHSWGQRVYQGYENNIWLEFRNNQVWGSTAWFGHGGGNFYMITYNNIAMIQTGHSNGAATSDEQKILSNLIFYMNQILFNMYYNVDYAAMDITPPTVPVIQSVNSDYVFDSEDIGNNYKYYVEAYTKDGIAPENYIETSNIADALVKTELKGYYYIIDQNSQTVVTESNGTYIDKDNNKVSPGLQNIVRYLHVAAIDNGGNISATRTIEIPARLTISYDKNQDEATGTMTDQIINYGQTAIIKTNEFSWVKHRFTNWNVSKDNSGQVFMPGDTVTYQALAPKYGYNIIMYAQWEPLYKLEINPQSGEYLGNSQKQTYWLGKDDEKIIDDATRIGYNFRGWTIDILRE